jgi:PTH1 family peptidyl-tRNA hydrolase
LWLVAGLGNPGPEFADTRHNIGWMLVAALREAWAASRPRHQHGSLVATAKVGDQDVVLAQPLMYMNCSGVPIRQLVQEFDIKLENLLIICDDINLPFGHLRLRAKGSDGGHKGLRSITEELGSEDFARLRMGIGAPPPDMDAAEWVLASFDDSQWDGVAEMLRDGIAAVEACLDQGMVAAQEVANTPRSQSQDEGR